ncbi:MAG TPA: ribosome silencing factor [Acidobacteriaceae bacterium]|nr:ribosome silencing factor [Acidobacteriaceae bacterium]
MAGASKKSGGKTAAKHTSKKAAGTKRAAARSGLKAAAKPRPTKSGPAAKSGPAKKAAPAHSPERMVAESTRQMVAAAAAACEEKKAEDIRILELDAVDAGFTDFFLITSGTNERQTQTIADEVELRMKREFGTYPNSVEGKRQGEWILLDYVDFVVHIFLAEKRAFYDIERLRKSARHVDAVELQKALKKKTASTRKRVATNAAAASHANP